LELARRWWGCSGCAQRALKRLKVFFDQRQIVAYIEPWPENNTVTTPVERLTP